MILRRLVRLIGMFCILFVLIGFFPVIGDICNAVFHHDIYVNYDKYKKTYVKIDSLYYFNTDGSDTDDVTGYSKQLNNYKTKILFGDVRDDENVNDEELDENGAFKQNVWYRKGIDYAYPAKKEDKLFPIKDFVYKKAKIPILWFLAIIISFVTYKISKKSKLFKKANEDENKN